MVLTKYNQKTYASGKYQFVSKNAYYLVLTSIFDVGKTTSDFSPTGPSNTDASELSKVILHPAPGDVDRCLHLSGSSLRVHVGEVGILRHRLLLPSTGPVDPEGMCHLAVEGCWGGLDDEAVLRLLHDDREGIIW